jgi:hypothetical protein
MQGNARFGWWVVLSVVWGSLAVARPLKPRLINGTVVTDNTWNMVVNITSSKPDNCTGTIIGPRVIITNASCFMQGNTATFTVNGTTYTAAMTLSPLYPAQEHDVALGLTSQDITGVVPASIGGAVTTGLGITMLGYGCDQDPGTNPASFDGKLRVGTTVVTGTQGLYMITGNGTGSSNGALLCYRDNGGPAFVGTGASKLVAINTFGDRKTENYSTRLDISQSTSFIQTFITANGNAEICGVNGTAAHCQSGPPPTAATCNLTATPSSVQVGQAVTLTLTTQNATAATINGATANPAGDTKNVTTSATGTFTANATVNGPGGPGSCSAQYTVTNLPPPPPDAPTCTVTATPQEVTIGDPVTLQLTVTSPAGTATSASINGVAVAIPTGTSVVTPSDKGDVSVKGFVSGPKGSNNCYAWYHVDDNGGGPTVPNFAVIPNYCGSNSATGSTVQQVCLAVVKKDDTIGDLRITQVVQVTYADGTKEEMPLIDQLASATSPTQFDLKLFANAIVVSDTYQVLDMRDATLVTDTSGSQSHVGIRTGPTGTYAVPISIEGRSATGQYFKVTQLNAVGTTF